MWSLQVCKYVFFVDNLSGEEEEEGEGKKQKRTITIGASHCSSNT